MNAVSVLHGMGLSVRLDEEGALVLGGLKSLPPEDRGAAVALAREHKARIVEALQKASPVAHTEEQHAAALAYARRLLVSCPSTGGKLQLALLPVRQGADLYGMARPPHGRGVLPPK